MCHLYSTKQILLLRVGHPAACTSCPNCCAQRFRTITCPPTALPGSQQVALVLWSLAKLGYRPAHHIIAALVERAEAGMSW